MGHQRQGEIRLGVVRVVSLGRGPRFQRWYWPIGLDGKVSGISGLTGIIKDRAGLG